jgi:bifunctional non-homologous end joining protein LigD
MRCSTSIPIPPADFNDTRYVARLVKTVLDQLQLASYPKTSGGTGMQIYVPLDGTSEYELMRAVVGRICLLVHRADPEATTLEWEVSRRAGRVYLDANMNRAGASFSAPYSVRAKWNAPVSIPFAWDELDTVESALFYDRERAGASPGLR